MKYFLDTEFLEGPQQKRFLGIPCGKTKPTIDLISIGICCENGKEYYAISKDFNLKEAWNRYDIKSVRLGDKFYNQKTYWIRENVLRPIYIELHKRYNSYGECGPLSGLIPEVHSFTYEAMDILVNAYGKTNRQIAEEAKHFVYKTSQINDPESIANWENVKHLFPVDFYTYYGDYDWVVFCWLFGKMIDLPKGFPMFSNDLKQKLDSMYMKQENKYEGKTRLESWLKDVKNNPGYPKQENEHNALADARWNKKLYDFLQNI